MRIEFLYFSGCPNVDAARDALRRALRAAGLPEGFEQIEVKSPEAAARLRFLGSPSVRINGLDAEPAARTRRDFGLSCRTYAGGGAPSVRDIEAAIREAAAQERGEPARRSFVGRVAGVLALFTSTGTLLCCALPAALAAIAARR